MTNLQDLQSKVEPEICEKMTGLYITQHTGDLPRSTSLFDKSTTDL